MDNDDEVTKPSPRRHTKLHTARRFLLVLISFSLCWLCVSIYSLGGPEEAAYSLVPYVPTQWFQAFAVCYVYLYTVWILPISRSLNLVSPALPCRENGNNDLMVIVAGPKGGTVLAARTALDVGGACGLRVGVGFREHSDWPPCEESVPPFEADIMMAISNVRTWPEYAKPNQRVRCVVITRHPLARFQSLLQYSYDAGEFHLRHASMRLKSMSVSDGVQWMLDHFGNQTMTQSHQYLLQSLAQPGCIQVKFESLNGDFDAAMSKWLVQGWGITDDTAVQGLLTLLARHDMSRLNEEQQRANHHISAARVAKQHQSEMKRALMANERLVKWLEIQAKELGY